MRSGPARRNWSHPPSRTSAADSANNTCRAAPRAASLARLGELELIVTVLDLLREVLVPYLHAKGACPSTSCSTPPPGTSCCRFLVRPRRTVVQPQIRDFLLGSHQAMLWLTPGAHMGRGSVTKFRSQPGASTPVLTRRSNYKSLWLRTFLAKTNSKYASGTCWLHPAARQFMMYSSLLTKTTTYQIVASVLLVPSCNSALALS